MNPLSALAIMFGFHAAIKTDATDELKKQLDSQSVQLNDLNRRLTVNREQDELARQQEAKEAADRAKRHEAWIRLRHDCAATPAPADAPVDDWGGIDGPTLAHHEPVVTIYAPPQAAKTPICRIHLVIDDAPESELQAKVELFAQRLADAGCPATWAGLSSAPPDDAQALVLFPDHDEIYDCAVKPQPSRASKYVVAHAAGRPIFVVSPVSEAARCGFAAYLAAETGHHLVYDGGDGANAELLAGTIDLLSVEF